jgi:hypothetical protein
MHARLRASGYEVFLVNRQHAAPTAARAVRPLDFRQKRLAETYQQQVGTPRPAVGELDTFDVEAAELSRTYNLGGVGVGLVHHKFPRNHRPM